MVVFIPEDHIIECLECNFAFHHIFTDDQIKDSIPKPDGTHINPFLKYPNCNMGIEITNLKSNKL